MQIPALPARWMKRPTRSYHLNMPEEKQSANGAVADSQVAEIIVSPPRASMRVRWAERTFIVALCLYAVLAMLAHRYAYFEWDLELARRIQSISLPGFGAVMTGVSVLGNGFVPWLLVVVAGLALMRAGLRLEGLLCIAEVSSGWFVNRLSKLFIARPRPTDALLEIAGNFKHESFPSGHVMFFVELFGFLFFLGYVLLEPGRLRRAALAVFGLLIVLIGLSRVYLGAHWPSDVAGAYLAGAIWLMLWIEVYRRAKAKST